MQEPKQVNTLCALCDRKLVKRQKKFCSQVCRTTVQFKLYRIAGKEALLKKRDKAYPLPKGSDTNVYIPDVLLAKPPKEKIYKQKVFTKINKKYAPKKIKQNREEVKNMWKWYWDVKFNQEPLDKNMATVWRYYDYLLKNEKYQSTR